MGQEYGKDWRIQIGDGATPEVFSSIGGEISFDWKRSSKSADIATKDDGVYGSTSFIQQDISISVNGNVKLPDAGLKRASDVSKLLPPQCNVKIMNGAVIKFSGMVSIGNFSSSFPKDGPATYSFDTANVGAPTVDDLAA